MQYQLSQRAEFFEEIVGLETTLKRPIVNTRDEPHADPKRFRRLHVIVGDANLSEIATFLKVGSTAIVLAMVEDDAGPTRELSLSDPVRALHQVSADLTLTRPLALTDGSTATALEMQWELFGAARKYAEEFGLGALGDDGEVGALVLEHWEAVLSGLESDPAAAGRHPGLGGQARAPARLPGPPLVRLEGPPGRRTGVAVPRPAAGQVRVPAAWTCARWSRRPRSPTPSSEPPTGTRAWFRGKCLARWPDAVVTANWDSLVFDVGADPLRRVPMMDPLKGTAEHTGDLLAQSTGPSDLLNRLNS